MPFCHAVLRAQMMLLLACHRFNEYFSPSFHTFYLMLHFIHFIKRLPANHGAQLNIMVLFIKISIFVTKYFKSVQQIIKLN